MIFYFKFKRKTLFLQMPLSEIELVAYTVSAKNYNWSKMSLREKLLQKRLFKQVNTYLKNKHKK